MKMLTLSKINGLVSLLLPDLNGVMQGNQDKGALKRPYCTWTITSESEYGLAARGQKDAVNPLDITQFIERNKQVVIDFSFYTDTKQRSAEKLAREFCNEFLNKLNLFSTSEYFAANDMALLSYTDYANMDEHLGDNWERRAMCELTINYVDSVEETIPTITYDPNRDAGITGTYLTP